MLVLIRRLIIPVLSCAALPAHPLLHSGIHAAYLLLQFKVPVVLREVGTASQISPVPAAALFTQVTVICSIEAVRIMMVLKFPFMPQRRNLRMLLQSAQGASVSFQADANA